MKKICYFGIYDPKYSRNRILIRGWKENGYEVVECRVDPKEYPGLKKYIELYKKYRSIRKHTFEFVVVGFPGHTVMFLARILFGKVIFDAFLSLYDSNVFDRRLYSKYSVSSLKDYVLDFSSIHLAHRVLIDTYEHIKYFNKTFFIKEDIFIRVPISADDSIFFPMEKPVIKNLIHFHGMFIPLQGIDHILDTAKIMEGYHFRIIGRGQLFEKINNRINVEQIKNIEMLGMMDIQTIPNYIAESEVCLGIFGDTDKTDRVIPNKVYECIAMGRPVVTLDTSAIREIFNDEDMVLSKSSSAKDIKDAIIKAQKTTHYTCLKTYENKLKPRSLVLNLLVKLNQS